MAEYAPKRAQARLSVGRACFLLALVLALAPLASSAPAEAAPGAVAQALPRESGRSVYLTAANVNAAATGTACAAGYRMASLWEILDTSNWRYAYTHPQAYTRSDSGQGPPAQWYGWVRTGYDSSAADVVGSANCAGWTSSSGTDYGTAVRLTNTWETPPGGMPPWDARTWACSGIAPVWCVSDVSTVYLPLVLK